jgi:uncharacterized protein DUF998
MQSWEHKVAPLEKAGRLKKKSADRAARSWRRVAARLKSRRRPAHSPAVHKTMLACGLAYPLAYVVANDVVAARLYHGYSRTDQAISELSATKAPSRGFLNAMLPIFVLLVTGFGLGVRQAAGESKPLRLTGNVLVAQGFVFPIWLLFPMTSREEMVEGGKMAGNDRGHLALTAVAIGLILAELGLSAAALGKRFRLFSIAMGATALVSGGLTGAMSSDIEKGSATRRMGLVERISYGSWLLWMAALAIALLRRETAEATAAPNSTGGLARKGVLICRPSKTS